MKNANIKYLWEEFVNNEKYKKYLLDKEDKWSYILGCVKKYIDDNHMRPNSESNDPEIKALGNWISNNVVYYETKKDIPVVSKFRTKNRQILWTEFINDPIYSVYFISSEVSWTSKLEVVKKYIDDNNYIPTYYRCKTKDDKEIGKWLDHQVSNYNTQTGTVYNNTQIKLVWKQFIKEYKIYFMTQEDKWIEKLDNCKQFIKDNKKRPANKSHVQEERTMAYWIANQIKNYRTKNEILGKTESLQKIWVPFITDLNNL